MRELYRKESQCQIIHDSALSRGKADPYLILAEGQIGGYGAAWNEDERGTLIEFYTIPKLRIIARQMFRELLAASKATHIEAQTNIPMMLSMLNDFTVNITARHLLFKDAFPTQLPCPNGVFRRTTPEDMPTMFPHHLEPVGGWCIEADGAIVATGDFLCHYNPPYGDIHMEVKASSRRQGFGSYIVQELKRVCYEAGKTPGARCSPANVGSRRTLEKAGFILCGELLTGEVCAFT